MSGITLYFITLHPTIPELVIYYWVVYHKVMIDEKGPEPERKYEPSIQKKGAVPVWYVEYTKNIPKDKLLDEVRAISTLSIQEINSRMGGNIAELPYDCLKTLFIDGSDDQEVVLLLRNKRETYLKGHPEVYNGVRGALEGIVSYDGRVVSMEDWKTASDSEKRGVLVGSTCFHYNSDTPGMGSSPKDRW